MQVEIVLEVTTHPPQPVGHAVVEVALLGGMGRIETAANEIRKIDLLRIGAARSVAREADPQVEIGGEGRLRDIDARELVEEDAGVDDLLAPREPRLAEID